MISYKYDSIRINKGFGVTVVTIYKDLVILIDCYEIINYI